MNKTFTNYSYFPSNPKRFQSCTNVEKHEIKRTDPKSNHNINIDRPEGTVLKNYFPTRKKKIDNQSLINMLYKYNRHYQNSH